MEKMDESKSDPIESNGYFVGVYNQHWLWKHVFCISPTVNSKKQFFNFHCHQTFYDSSLWLIKRNFIYHLAPCIVQPSPFVRIESSIFFCQNQFGSVVAEYCRLPRIYSPHDSIWWCHMYDSQVQCLTAQLSHSKINDIIHLNGSILMMLF